MKKAMNVTPAKGSLTARAHALAEKTADAYSSDRFASWPAVVRFLLARGYTEKEAEAMLRSKWMRWAGDSANDPSRPTSVDVMRFIDSRGATSIFKSDDDFARQLRELVRETFPEAT